MNIITTESQQMLEREVSPVLDRAKSLVIKTSDDSLEAQEVIKAIKQRIKKVEETFDPIVSASHAAWKAACDKRNSFLDPLRSAESLIKNKVVSYEEIQERKRQDEARKAEASRLEAERKEKERLEAMAQKAEEAGKLEKAEALRENAAQVVVQPILSQPEAQKAKGAAFKKVWQGEVTDLKALCQAIAEGKAPVNLVDVNQAALNNLARGVKDSMPIPGVRFVEKTSLSMRVA